MNYPKWLYNEEFPQGKLFNTTPEGIWFESPALIGTAPVVDEIAAIEAEIISLEKEIKSVKKGK